MTEAAATATVAMRGSTRGNLALLATSVVLALLVGEIAARMILPAPLPWLHPQVGYRADPALIFGLMPNQRGYSADKPVAINERGLRGPVVPYERTPGLRRILFLGDSITFGYGVNDAEVVTERVRTLLGASGVGVEVVNSAVPSYNMRQEMTYLETEGFRYDPDWVIVGVCWNDIGDKSAVRVDSLGRLTTEPDAEEPASVRIRNSESGYALRNVLKRSRLMYGALEGWRRLDGRKKPDQQTVFRTNVLEGRETSQVSQGWEDVRTELQRLARLAERDKFRVLLVPFPIPMALGRSFPNSSYPARLRELAAEANMPILDLEPAFRAAYHGHESLFIAYDGDHPNAAGHDVAARAITAYLTTADRN